MLRIKLYLGLATSRDAENLQNFVSVVVKNQVVPRSRYVYGVLNSFLQKSTKFQSLSVALVIPLVQFLYHFA